MESTNYLYRIIFVQLPGLSVAVRMKVHVHTCIVITSVGNWIEHLRMIQTDHLVT